MGNTGKHAGHYVSNGHVDGGTYFSGGLANDLTEYFNQQLPSFDNSKYNKARSCNKLAHKDEVALCAQKNTLGRFVFKSTDGSDFVDRNNKFLKTMLSYNNNLDI